jgi:hypothetical protein
VVKGGKQDRTFPYDFIAPPRSGKLPIESFCVEQGRWAKRGSEPSVHFSSSAYSLSSKELKLAASEQMDQSEVWAKVARIQAKLAANLGKGQLSQESASSYQLAVENPDLKTALAPYLEALEFVPGDRADIVGVVVAINGKVASADIYASSRLFEKLWHKLLVSAALEAFAELQKGKPVASVPLPAIEAFLQQAEAGQPAGEAVTEHVYVHRLQTGKQALFDTCDRGRNNLVIHRSVLAR